LSIGKELRVYDQDSNLIEMGKVTKIMKKSGLSEINLEKAFAGDIVLLSGFPSSRVTHTLVEEGFPDKRIPCLKIDEPLMGVSISVNTSPLAGKEGTKIALNDIKVRLKEEAENDVALTVLTDAKGSGSVQVRGRGDL
jgi:GTP-binding protein